MTIDQDDPRVLRIATALADGCDGRSFASADAKRLHSYYRSLRDNDPAASFSDCRIKAFCRFIAEVLNKTPTKKAKP